ncbi:plastocyanin/azurin family copper-binding protein [Flagellimonas sp. 2504JD4-2]
MIYKSIKLCLLLASSPALVLNAQSHASTEESKYYKIVDVPIPEDISLEVGGLALTDNDKLGVSTRRGDVWLIDKPYSETPVFKRFAHGLHEALGLTYRNNSFYLAQRGELTQLIDKNRDDIADVYKTIYSWPLSGNYHEYSYGPKFLPNGDMLVTLNLSWIGYGASLAKWRGWLLQISQQGEMEPVASGLRSPAGFVVNDEGAVFYSENQGGWVGSGRITQLEKGDFAGNPEGLIWTDDEKSPLKLKKEDIEPQSGLTLFEYTKKVPELKAPAIWLPHAILGISTSDLLFDTTKGGFGPFENQLFVGDQGHSKIMRVYMEKVNGVYQGAVFPFVEGFSSGILRMIWGSDNSMFVGMTSRGWPSTGPKSFGLQRLVWSGKTPFEIKTMKAQDDGFLLEFTQPVNRLLGNQKASYEMTSFTYKYHNSYGSPIINQEKAIIQKAEVGEDGLSVKLTIQGLRQGYIHEIKIPDLKSISGEKLLHNKGYYTLNQLPSGSFTSNSMTPKQSVVKKIEQPKRTNTMPISWSNGPERSIVIGTKPGLKYNVDEIIIAKRKKIELTFNNNDDMLHNLVITKKGVSSVDKVGDMALKLGLDGADLNYVPFTDLVLYHTGVVKPEAQESIFFEAPSEPGEYWIVCTFPGHSQIMRTKLIVK